MRAASTTTQPFLERVRSGKAPLAPRLFITLIAFACLATAWPRSSSAADPAPASQPAAPAAAARRPDTRPTGDVMARAWAELTHRDPGVRDAARLRLMGMSADQLPAFRKLVAASRPLAPSQAILLREIVTHVFLAAQIYEANSRDAFLGVVPVEVNLSVRPEPIILPNQPAQPADENPPVVGVMIGSRMPGFCAARYLQDGDIIVAIDELPEFHIEDATQFSRAVRGLGAGRSVHLRVLRQGRVALVPLTLDVRPALAETEFRPQFAVLLEERERAAQAYWDSQFAPLLKQIIG